MIYEYKSRKNLGENCKKTCKIVHTMYKTIHFVGVNHILGGFEQIRTNNI